MSDSWVWWSAIVWGPEVTWLASLPTLWTPHSRGAQGCTAWTTDLIMVWGTQFKLMNVTWRLERETDRPVLCTLKTLLLKPTFLHFSWVRLKFLFVVLKSILSLMGFGLKITVMSLKATVYVAQSLVFICLFKPFMAYVFWSVGISWKASELYFFYRPLSHALGRKYYVNVYLKLRLSVLDRWKGILKLMKCTNS